MSMGCDGLYTPRDGRNYMRFNYWMLSSLVVFSVATVLFKHEILRPGVLAWTLSLTAVVLMSVAVRAYVHFLRNADELLRKVHLEALAIAFGVGAVVMMLTWLGGQWAGTRRYATTEEQ